MKPTQILPKTLLSLIISGALVIGLTACGTDTGGDDAANVATSEPDTTDHMGMVDDAHAHAAPHGGTVQPAGSGHLEMVVSGGYLIVYPLDDAEQALSVEGIEGATATVQAEGGMEHAVPLTAMGDHLMGTMPEDMHHFSAHVRVPVKGETWSARFMVDSEDNAAHEH